MTTKAKDHILAALDRCIKEAKDKNPSLVPALTKKRKDRLRCIKDAAEFSMSAVELAQLLQELEIE